MSDEMSKAVETLVNAMKAQAEAEAEKNAACRKQGEAMRLADAARSKADAAYRAVQAATSTLQALAAAEAGVPVVPDPFPPLFVADEDKP